MNHSHFKEHAHRDLLEPYHHEETPVGKGRTYVLVAAVTLIILLGSGWMAADQGLFSFEPDASPTGAVEGSRDTAEHFPSNEQVERLRGSLPLVFDGGVETETNQSVVAISDIAQYEDLSPTEMERLESALLDQANDSFKVQNGQVGGGSDLIHPDPTIDVTISDPQSRVVSVSVEQPGGHRQPVAVSGYVIAVSGTPGNAIVSIHSIATGEVVRVFVTDETVVRIGGVAISPNSLQFRDLVQVTGIGIPGVPEVRAVTVEAVGIYQPAPIGISG